jgi:hypothetical protein
MKDGVLKRLAVLSSTALWLAACVAGLCVLLRYQTTPGAAGTRPRSWPAASRLHPAAGRDTLLVFAHPRCPCTRATLDSVAWTMSRSRNEIAAYVLFYKPSSSSANWEKTGLWDDASAIPGVTTLRDVDGIEAKNFGAETSGQALLYDSRGRLAFRGGLTSSRGHAGDSAGRDAVLSLARRGTAEISQTPVFGCSLLRAETSRSDEDKPWTLRSLIATIAR